METGWHTFWWMPPILPNVFVGTLSLLFQVQKRRIHPNHMVWDIFGRVEVFNPGNVWAPGHGFVSLRRAVVIV